MITIKTFECNPLQENTYIVHDETADAVIIDCGAMYDDERGAIVSYLRDNNLTLRHVLCTHGHLDHCFGNDTLHAEFGVLPEVHAADEYLASNLAQQAFDFFGIAYSRPTPPIGRLLAHGDSIGFGTHTLQVLHTPGHTPGGVVYYCQDEHAAFTGDTLFRMSVGRTDFPRGSWTDLMKSLTQMLAALPPATVLYPGHGPKTTMADEKQFNPYMK